jgi:hypothetical protein
MADETAQALIDSRIARLACEHGDLRRRVGFYRRFSHVAVFSGIVFPVLAGSTLLGDAAKDWTVLGVPWPMLAGGLALLATVLTAVHKGFDCEKYQANARLVLHEALSLIEGYETLRLLEGAAFGARLEILEARLEAFRKRGFDVPPGCVLRHTQA